MSINKCLLCTQDKGECLKCESDYHLINNLCCENECKIYDKDVCLEGESSEKFGQKCENCPSTCEKVGKNERKCKQESRKCTLCENGKRGIDCIESYNESCDISENICN